MKSESSADAWITAVGAMPAIASALVVDASLPSGHDGGCVFLFVVLRPGQRLNDTLLAEIQRCCAVAAHGPVPDAIYAAADLPRSNEQQILGVAARRMMAGEPAARVATEERVANPAALEYFAWLFSNL